MLKDESHSTVRNTAGEGTARLIIQVCRMPSWSNVLLSVVFWEAYIPKEHKCTQHVCVCVFRHEYMHACNDNNQRERDINLRSEWEGFKGGESGESGEREGRKK